LVLSPSERLSFAAPIPHFFGLSTVMILLVSGKIGLLEVDDVNDDTRRWAITVRRLLALPSDGDRYRKPWKYDLLDPGDR
jgi:hypothetical protein